MAEIIKIEELREYLREEEDSDQDEILEQILGSACDVVRYLTNQNFDLRAYSETRNGGGRRAIMARQIPIAASPLPTAVENGVSLTVAVGYSQTADVVVDLRDGFFRRQAGSTQVQIPPGTAPGEPGTWSRGFQNVVLGYTGGFPEAQMPRDVKLLAKYLASLFWHDSDAKRIGVLSRSTGNSSVQFQTELPAHYQAIVNRWRRPPVID